MNIWRKYMLWGVSVTALSLAHHAAAQDKAATPAAVPQSADEGANDIVVTGIRQSLERAAEIKQEAVQVVDSIVATDIGKFPDPTTAAALQRVPGVQVQYDKGNELGGVRIRGLPDTLTTVNGREVFSAVSRNFDLKDLPAEALARVDVVKSQTADLIEGGLAGTIDLQLNKPFDFRKPAFILTARGNYGIQTDKLNPQVGALIARRFNTGIGEMGVVVNATYNKTETFQPETTGADPRATATPPLNTAQNYIFPSIFQNITQSGDITHAQLNASYQWQVSPAVQFYADGFYTYTRNTVSYSGGGNVQPYTTGTTISNIVASPDECYDTRFNAATGQNANVVVDRRTGRSYIVSVPAVAGGVQDTTLYKVQNLCFVKSATVNNVVINQTTHADNFTTKNKMIAGGLKYDQDGTKASFDVAYQTTHNYDETVTADVGQRLPTVMIETDVDEGMKLTIPGDWATNRNLFVRNSISQNYQLSTGNLLSFRGDVSHEFDWIIKKIQFGGRYARRIADYRQYNAVTPILWGNLGTANEAGNATLPAAKKVGDFPTLPAEFLEFGPGAPGINNGQQFLVPSVSFLRSERGRDILRGIFGLPLGKPAFQPSRNFDASETTWAGYGQATYELPLGSAIIDGVFGGRLTRTERSLDSFSQVGTGATATFVPVTTKKIDTDFLPNASVRLKLDNGIQFRGTYAKTIRRPNFNNLNPSLNLTLSANPFLVNTGSSGNPDLRPQKSDSFDASAEYYFKSGYIAVTGYYRNIKDRVITAPAIENFAGIDYSVSRPRNLGQAELKGVEVSGQYFFDFLPGAFSGIGAFGAFTFADSEIQGNDPLAGQPLQGVSKYNYTAGLLYDKYGLSSRLVYTYRSESWQDDATGNLALRPVDASRANEPYVPVLFRWLRPNGRLDFSMGYEISDAIRIDIGGTNITRTRNKTYWGVPFINSQVFRIDSTYTVGVRVRL